MMFTSTTGGMMKFEIPESAIQTEGFQVKSPANLFFLFMLSRNWHAWAAEYKPLRDFEQIYENQDSVAEQLAQHPDKNYWTVMGVDEGEYVTPGIEVLDSHGYYTHGFIETERPSSSFPWPGLWFPRISSGIPGFSIDYPAPELIRTVFIWCELCPEGEIDDCDHWDGQTGSWVTVDFALPAPDEAEEFLKEIVSNPDLGVLRCTAATVLVKEFLNLPTQKEEAADWTAHAVEAFKGLSRLDRELVFEDPKALPEFTYVMFAESAAGWNQDFGNLMLDGDAVSAEEVLVEIAEQSELSEENWTATNTLVFSILIPTGRFDEARVWCEELIRRSTGFEYWNAISNLGSVEYHSGNLDEAQKLFASIVEGEVGPVAEAKEFLGLISSRQARH